jgi:hypothetical protein
MALQAGLTVFFIVFGGGFRSEFQVDRRQTTAEPDISFAQLLLRHFMDFLPPHSPRTARAETERTQSRASLPDLDYHTNHLLRSKSSPQALRITNITNLISIIE